MSTQTQNEANCDETESNHSEKDFDDEDDPNCSGLHKASLTESYSEILNSPTKSTQRTIASNVGKDTRTMKIPLRRPATLTMTEEKCKQMFH